MPAQTSVVRPSFNPLRLLGRSTLAALGQVGAVAIFAARGVAAAMTPPWFPSQLLRQLAAVGYYSLPVVGLTAAFTGAALALNIYTGGGRFNAEQVMPQIVALGITRELGPVLAALMLAGRVSAAMLGVVAARATVAGRRIAGDEALYLRSPDVTAPKQAVAP